MLPYIYIYICCFSSFIPSVVGARLTVGMMVPIAVALIIILMLFFAAIILFRMGYKGKGNNVFVNFSNYQAASIIKTS